MLHPSVLRAVSPALWILLAASPAAAHPWPVSPGSSVIEQRIAPPAGAARIAVEPGSFGAWLRTLPVKEGRPPVRLFDGRRKANQEAHALVLDIDTGKKDLQQCADAVMRLYAEYQRASGAEDAICFRFTSGDAAWWKKWRQGERPIVRGNEVSWSRRGARDTSYQSFRSYLETVFLYAGSHSLERALAPVADPRRVEPGDVFIQGGFPGHAVLVLDVAEDEAGARWFLLGQSFMPAQEIHVLRVPENDRTLWYRAAASGPLVTPEWKFDHTELHRIGPLCR